MTENTKIILNLYDTDKFLKTAPDDQHLSPDEQMLVRLIKDIPGCIYYKSVDGVYLACSDYLIKTSKLPSTQFLIGKTDDDLFPKEQADALRKNDTEVMTSSKSSINEEHITLPDGTKRFYKVVKIPFKNKEGNLIGILGNSVDITELKNTQQELEKAKRIAESANEAKNQFLSNMRHDIRTPFSGILGLTEILHSRETDTGKQELLGFVQDSAKQLLNYLNDILKLCDLQSGLVPNLDEKFDLNELLDKTFKMFRAIMTEKNLNLIKEYSNDVPSILIGDHFRIHRVLINLLGNAVKFTDTGSITVKIELGKKIDGRHLIIKLTVKDTGIGIQATEHAKIFEMFYRAIPSKAKKYPGTGIGLYEVKQLLNALDGDIELESEEGKGSTFICTIPLKIPLLS